MTDSRAFRCRDCGNYRLAFTTTGPLPTACDDCDPEVAARREASRERSRQSAASRAQTLVALRARVADLEEQLAGAQTVPGAGRLELARAVRAVGHARGRDGTRGALLHLRDVAQSWANQLAVANEITPTQEAA